jgi:hypothetical protein
VNHDDEREEGWGVAKCDLNDAGPTDTDLMVAAGIEPVAEAIHGCGAFLDGIDNRRQAFLDVIEVLGEVRLELS